MKLASCDHNAKVFVNFDFLKPVFDYAEGACMARPDFSPPLKCSGGRYHGFLIDTALSNSLIEC